MESMTNDTTNRRDSKKAPLAPATTGLRSLMQKLGGLNARHEALVRRVDELEVINYAAVCRTEWPGGVMIRALDL